MDRDRIKRAEEKIKHEIKHDAMEFTRFWVVELVVLCFGVSMADVVHKVAVKVASVVPNWPWK